MEEAGVGALDEADSGVGAELHGDLAEAGVDGGDVGCAVLEEAVSEAAGGGAYVEAGAAGDHDGPVGEGGGELETAAADVLLLFAEEADFGVFRDGGAWFIELLLIDQDTASEDESAGTGAAGDQRAFDEQKVEADFGGLFKGNRILFQELPSIQRRNTLVRTGMAGIC